ncbi:MAG: hypothetical protein LBQ00_05675 [Syntrophobacterales bacterium]|jgi:Na+/proline symporter|nr:hypothetical protein [Syntrophobacterales bacterium]
MLDCSSNGLVARIIFGQNLLENKQWGADLAAPMLAWAMGGSGLLAAYLTGLVGATLGTLSAMVFIMSANITNDIIKLWAPKVSDKSMLYLGYFLTALFLFMSFWWTPKRPPELLSSVMGLAAMGLGYSSLLPLYLTTGREQQSGRPSYGTVTTLCGDWAVLD